MNGLSVGSQPFGGIFGGRVRLRFATIRILSGKYRLTDLQRLSRPYGTEIEIKDGVGFVDL